MWDATVVDTLAPSHLNRTCREVGSAASQAEELKRQKYVGNLPLTYEFLPLGFETLGAVGPAAREFLSSLGKRLCLTTGSARAGEYLMQRLSLELLRGNAGSIVGSLEQRDMAVDWCALDGGVGNGGVGDDMLSA